MNLLRNIFSSLLTFFLVPLLATFLFTSNFGNVLLNENNFLGTLKENKTYETVSSQILPSLVISNVSSSSGGNGLPKEVLDNLFSKIDKTKLASDLETVVTDTYRYTTGKTSDLVTKIDITPYTNIIETQLKPVFIDYYKTLATCTVEQQKQIEEENAMVDCQIQGVSAEEAASQNGINQTISDLQKNAPKTLTIMKDRIVLDPPLPNTNTNQNNESKSQTSLQNVRNFTRLGNPANTALLITIFICTILLILVHLPNFAEICRSLAWVLISASVLPLLASSAFLYFINTDTIRSNLISAVGTNTNSDYQTAILNLVTANLYSLGHKFFQGVQIEAVILAVVSLALFVIAIVIEKRTHLEKKVESAQPELGKIA